jgi:succinyl-CoA synthetase beta subunit
MLPVLDEEPKPMPPPATVDEVPMTKTCARSVDDVAEELRKTLAAKASQKAEGRGKATGKAKSEAKGKAKASPKAKSAPSFPVTSPTKKVPSMPP